MDVKTRRLLFDYDWWRFNLYLNYVRYYVEKDQPKIVFVLLQLPTHRVSIDYYYNQFILVLNVLNLIFIYSILYEILSFRP